MSSERASVMFVISQPIAWGVDIDRDFAAEYVAPEAKTRVVKELKAEGSLGLHNPAGE